VAARIRGAIVGRHTATIQDTAMVATALKMALQRRDHTEHSVGAWRGAV
jgi:hypothetical protein